MSYSPPPVSQSRSQISNTQQLIPKKQQWHLINQYKAIQYERLKQMEKTMDMQKKRQFKQQLDHQLNGKSDVNQQEKQADRRYYQFITKRAEQMKERQQRQKYNKFMKRKQIQQENQYYLDGMKNSRNKDYDSGYHLDIGHKSQMQRKNMQEYHKKQMLDTLDKQLQIKAQEKRKQRMYSLETDEANLKYQNDQFERRKSQGRRFSQNENIYQHYKNIQQQKKIKQKQFDHKIVDEAAQKKMQQQDFKRYMKQKQKAMMTNQMKNTLDLQIDIQHRKSQQEKRVNPQQHTYSVIGNMFKQRPLPYNKQQYSQYLRKQTQQANLKKKKQQYMSEQQYRINMNQLNRAVSGTYAYQKYIDRSIGSIGDNLKINRTQITNGVNDQDSQVVKMRLENLKSRRPYGPNDSNIY